MVEEFESVQFALYTPTPPALDALKFWDAMFGTSPAGFQTVNPGHTQAQGVVAGLDVIAIAQQNRFDIVMQGQAPVPPALPPVAIPDIDKAISDGLAYIEKAIPLLTVGRVAAVIQGNCFAASSIEAVQKFSQAHPNLKVPADATAAAYEFTVPKNSNLNPNRRLIRLCKWNTVQAQYFNIGAAQMQVAQRFASHSYVDVFSEAMESLSAADVSAALQEVVAEAKSIIDGGSNGIA